jgi:tryptophan synthase beta subunit
MVDPEFVGELERLHRTYTGRPSIVTEVPRFAEHAGGARVILKREDLNHTGSHKINNVLGQALLTRRMGKSRVIAETGAGQHGVATATAAACSASTAPSTWARSTPSDRPSTSPGCGCSVPMSSRSPPAARP